VNPHVAEVQSCPVEIPAGRVNLEGDLTIPPNAAGIVLFAHGSGSSRHSPRNRFVADYLNSSGLATLLFDLLSLKEEEDERSSDNQYRFDIPLLAQRLERAIKWTTDNELTAHLNIGLIGSSTGAAAALVAATRRSVVKAVVSRGGRPDLAGSELQNVSAPTLFIVGGDDELVWQFNERALQRMSGVVDLKIVPGATHLFEEPGALEEVSRLAVEWFHHFLQPVGAH
jgi:dienelactone hydrolase